MLILKYIVLFQDWPMGTCSYTLSFGENSMTVFHTLGFPRVGAQRELKWALESYWRGDSSLANLQQTAIEVRQQNWQEQVDAGLEILTAGDFALYDHVLNTSYLLGHLPERARTGATEPLDQLFLAARGRTPNGTACAACEMTKWFDTNYHYMVPEFTKSDTFKLTPELYIEEIKAAASFAKANNKSLKAVILGPLSYLYLGRSIDGVEPLELLDSLIPVYQNLIQAVAEQGADWLQIDEPILSLDLDETWRGAFEPTYSRLQTNNIKLLIASYFADLDENLSLLCELPVQGVHLDVCAAKQDLSKALDRIGPYKTLSIGIIDGRNIWRSDLANKLEQLKEPKARLGERLWIATSCSLLHVPYDLDSENDNLGEVKQWLAFAKQKLQEGQLLAAALDDESLTQSPAFKENQAAVSSRETSNLIHKPAVKEQAAKAAKQDWQRGASYGERLKLQQASLNLPNFPTTTIGSFPQTDDVRQLRKAFKQGDIDKEQYEQGIKKEIELVVRKQEEIGIDVLVHGEPERNDMVEFFGERLEGVAASSHGWVQSYGSRCVKPPIIFGDIERPEPMTVYHSQYAKSLTDKPMKGMLTGPVTILKWAFVRDDQPWADTGYQIAAALRAEVKDLEQAGIEVIQVDEPGLREGLPLRAKDRAEYLQWGVNSFRYATTDVELETQIHTHMCYADFDDILGAIQAMDADVITLETARSANTLLKSLKAHPYNNGIGPGVYDIHSPNVPKEENMRELLSEAAKLVPIENLWVNPDCGLKTRRWEEVEPALIAMVNVAKSLR